jgi:ribonuclease R
MFVELKDLFISGVVKLIDMADDYYEFDPKGHRLTGRRTGKVYRIGQEVTLKLVSINKARRHINFVLVDDEAGKRKRGARKGRRKRGRK